MKSRILTSIIAIIFLSGFVGSQVIVSTHSYYISSSSHAAKETKSSSITEKCRICDIQHQNNLLFQQPDLPSFDLVRTQVTCVYIQGYSGIKLIKSSSRSPPGV